MSLLQKQLAAHRQKHGLSEKKPDGKAGPPSILFTLQEARFHDSGSIAALALHGLSELMSLEPDLAACTVLFEGPRRDRDGMTKEQNADLDKDLRHLLRLISPHLLSRGAQECLEGLLHRYHVHRWNVDDVLACALPYHDSPLFTRLLQGLQIEGKPQWSWLQPLKEKPATLVRSALAKYCSKDLSVLHFIGGALQEMVKLHKTNRPLSTFFAAVWLDTLQAAKTMKSDLVEAALPPVLAALRRPHLQDSFHAALAVVAALCVRTELEDAAHGQLLERAARQLGGEQGRPATALLALLLQLQRVEALPERALHSIAAAGPEALTYAIPNAVDCTTLLAATVEGCLCQAALRKEDVEATAMQELVAGLLRDANLMDAYATPVALAALQAYCHAVQQDPRPQTKQRAATLVRQPLATLASRQPVALGAALRRAAEAAVRNGLPAEELVQLVDSSPVAASGGSNSSVQLTPVVEALSSGSAQAKAKAIQKAVEDLKASSGKEEDAPRQRLLASLLLQSAQDKSREVAKTCLGMRDLWVELPQVEAASASKVLEAILASRVRNAAGKGSGLREMCQHTIQETETLESLPPVLQCFSWVYGREDCPEALRTRIDALLLPLLVLCLVSLDVAEPNGGQKAGLAELRTAVLAFCKVSDHTLLSKLSDRVKQSEGTTGALGPLSQAAADAADSACVLGLCQLVEARPWPHQDQGPAQERGDTTGLLGGAAAQAASAALLALALPRVVSSLGIDQEAEKLANRSAEVCQQLARHQALVKAGEGECQEVVRQLLQASLSSLCSLEVLRGRGGAKAGGSKRRKSGQSGGTVVGLASAFKLSSQGLLRVALQQPRSFSGELRGGLKTHLQLLSPALLGLALGAEVPGQRTTSGSTSGLQRSRQAASAACTNALLMVRSLLKSESGMGWCPDQGLLVLLVARMVSAEAAEVRGAALEVLTTLENVEVQTSGCWDSATAAALRDAGVLRAATEVLPSKVWEAAEEEQLELTGLSAKSLEAALQQFRAHRTEILQSPSGAALALAKSVAGKGGKGFKSKTCAFWALGVSMLQAQDVEASPILPVLPPTGVLTGLASPLCSCVEEVATAGGEAPLALRTAALCFVGLVKRRAETVCSEESGSPGDAKALANEDKASHSFIQTVALPLCDSLTQRLRQGKPTSLSLQELVCLLCGGLAAASKQTSLPAELRSAVVAGLFALCASAALSPSSSREREAEEEPASKALEAQGRLLAAAEAALAEAAQDAASLHVMLQETQLLGRLAAPETKVAAEVLCRQVSGLKSGGGSLQCGGQTLLGSLADLAQSAGAELVRKESDSLAGTLEQLFLTIAALSENMAGTLTDDKSKKGVETLVKKVCEGVARVATGLGKRLTPAMLLAIVRACAALAPLMPAIVEAGSLSDQEGQTPLRCCVSALDSYAQPLRADILSSLKVGLERLWRFPELAAEAQANPSQIMQWDLHAQGKLRTLLHTLLLGQEALVETVDTSLCLSLAESAGRCACLDFLLLLQLARRGPDAKPAKRKKKRRASRKEEELAEEFLAEVPQLQTNDDAVSDDALQLLLAIPGEARYQSLATLGQSLCALALYVCKGSGGPGLLWGKALLPEALVGGLDKERALWVLHVGLQVITRFVSEHGLPSGLDEASVDTETPRATAILAEDEVQMEAVGLSLCYLGWSACTMRVLLHSESLEVASLLKSCKDQAQQLQALLLRSLAVNHPVTFFRALCLSQQVPGHCPRSTGGDLFSSSDFSSLAVESGMVAACEALEDRRKLREEKGEGEEVRMACAALCAAAARQTCGQCLAGADSTGSAGVAIVAWRFLQALARFGGRNVSGVVNELCLPAASSCLSKYAGSAVLAGSAARVAVASVAFVETAVAELGRAVLERLGTFVVPLLDCAALVKAEGKANPVEEHALSTLVLLVRTLGGFLSPYLGRTLGVLTARAQPWKTTLQEQLGWELSASVPKRLLLPALQKDVADASQCWESVSGELDVATADIEHGVVRMQRLSAVLVWVFSEASPEDVALDVDGAASALLRLLAAGSGATGAFLRVGGGEQDIPARLFQSGAPEERKKPGTEPNWVDGCSIPSLLRLNQLAARAFAHFALRLELEELRPRFSRLLEWSRNSQAHTLERQSERKGAMEAAQDADEACRAVALCAIMRGLVAEAPDVSEELLLPLVTKDLAAQLTAARRCAQQLAQQLRPAAKKRRRSGVVSGPRAAGEVLVGNTWWWQELAQAALSFVSVALRPAAGRAQGSKAAQDAVEAFLEPCCDLIEISEFLPPSEDCKEAASLLRSVQAALVVITGASDSAHVKRALTAVLAKSRSDDAEVRLGAVRCCHSIWSELGVQAAPGLSEVVMFASELLEDEDTRVEAAVRAMIKTMEDCTGESLQESLKH